VQYVCGETKTASFGDVNGDGLTDAVDASDVLAEYALISGGQAPSFSDDMKKAADVNRDGLTDAVDASQILAYYAYLSTGGKLSFEEYLAPPPVTTATTTTSAIVTTTTQPPRTDYNKYDLLSSDPSVAAKAFEKLADELRNDLFKGWMIDDVNGISGGQNHAKVILALLNYNQGISPEALGTDIALGKYSLDDIIYYSQMMNLPQTQKRYGKTIDFNKYVIDENFANYLEDITNKYYEWQNGNAEPLVQLMKQYGETHDVITLSNISNYTELCITFFVEDEMDNYDETGDRNLFNEQVIVPMYESYEQYKGYSYTR